MPDFSSLFAKRTSQDASKEISDFLTGKKNFNALSQPAQFVLNGLEKDEHHRTFMEQSQIHELQQNLVKGKQISADSGAWEQFENSFRSFIHTSGSRNKTFVPPPAEPIKTVKPAKQSKETVPYSAIKKFLKGEVPISAVPKRGQAVLQSLLKDKRSAKETALVADLTARVKEDPGLTWEDVDVGWRAFVLAHLTFDVKTPVVSSLSRVGQQAVFEKIVFDDFAYDYQNKFLPREYATLSKPEQWETYKKAAFKRLSERQSKDGVAFREAYEIPNSMTDPADIALKIQAENIETNHLRGLYRMVEENPGLSNEQLVQKYEGLEANVPMKGGRADLNYRTHYKVWDDARRDAGLLDKGLSEIKMTDFVRFAPETKLAPLSVQSLGKSFKTAIQNKITKFGQDKNYMALFDDAPVFTASKDWLKGMKADKGFRQAKEIELTPPTEVTPESMKWRTDLGELDKLDKGDSVPTVAEAEKVVQQEQETMMSAWDRAGKAKNVEAYVVRDESVFSKATNYFEKKTGLKTPLIRGKIMNKLTSVGKKALGIPDIPPQFTQALEGYWKANPSEIVSKFAVGEGKIALDVNKFTQWVNKINFRGLGETALIGVGTTVITDFVAKWAHLSSTEKDTMDFYVTEGLSGMQLAIVLASPEAGPVGVAVAFGAAVALPIMKLVDWLNKPNRLKKETDKEEKDFGKQFAWVRSYDLKSGEVKWYPGIFASKVGRMYGPEVKLEYGDLKYLRYRYNQDGTWEPYFEKEGRRYKTFNANSDDEIKWSEKQRKWFDGLRDYRILSDEESNTLFKKLARGEDISQQFGAREDDRSDLSTYQKDLLNWRDFFEYVQDETFGSLDETGRGFVPATRQFRREYGEGKFGNQVKLAEFGDKAPSPEKQEEMNKSLFYQEPQTLADFKRDKKSLRENIAFLDLFKQQTHSLLQAQQNAARARPGFLDAMKRTKLDNQKNAYLWYTLDTGFSPAQTLAELKQQNKTISERSDLNKYDKAYVTEKNIVRYFAKSLAERGLGDDLLENVTKHTTKYSTPGGTYTQNVVMDVPTRNVQNYTSFLEKDGTLAIENGIHHVNPPLLWNNHDEKGVQKWLDPGGLNKAKYMAPRKTSELEPARLQQILKGGQFGDAFKQSNPQYQMNVTWEDKFGKKKDDFKFTKGGLSAEKKQELKRYLDEEQKHDPTVREDPYYRKNDKVWAWDMFAKKYVKVKAERESPPKKPKPKPQQKHPYADSREQYLQKERERYKMTQAQWDEYLKSHGGYTPDEVAEQEADIKRKQKTHRPLSQSEMSEFKKAHGGKTPEEVKNEQRRKDAGHVREDHEQQRNARGWTQKRWDRWLKKHDGKTPSEVEEERRSRDGTLVKKDQPEVVKKPEVVIQPQKVTPKAQPDPYVALREYLKEQHNINIPKGQKITPKQYPWLALTEGGKPALFGDPELHNKMKLSDAYRVVTTKTGIVHTAYDPSKVQPKFFNSHETSVVNTY